MVSLRTQSRHVSPSTRCDKGLSPVVTPRRGLVRVEANERFTDFPPRGWISVVDRVGFGGLGEPLLGTRRVRPVAFRRTRTDHAVTSSVSSGTGSYRSREQVVASRTAPKRRFDGRWHHRTREQSERAIADIRVGSLGGEIRTDGRGATTYASDERSSKRGHLHSITRTTSRSYNSSIYKT